MIPLLSYSKQVHSIWEKLLERVDHAIEMDDYYPTTESEKKPQTTEKRGSLMPSLPRKKLCLSRTASYRAYSTHRYDSSSVPMWEKGLQLAEATHCNTFLYITLL